MFGAGCGLGRFCWLLVGAGEPTFCVVRVVVVGDVVTREPPDDDVVGLAFGALHAHVQECTIVKSIQILFRA